MPVFMYEARDNVGNLIKGKRESTSEDALAAELFREGVVPYTLMHFPFIQIS